MPLSRQLIEEEIQEAIRFSKPVAFIADTGHGNLKGIGPVAVFAYDGDMDATCDKMVRMLDRLHGLEVNFKGEGYDPRQKLDQLVSFLRLCVFFIGNSHVMLSMTDRPTLSKETRDWIFKRLDPNPRDPIKWQRSLDGDTRDITYDHVLFAKSRPQHVGMPGLDEPSDTPDDDEPRGWSLSSRSVGRRLRR